MISCGSSSMNDNDALTSFYRLVTACEARGVKTAVNGTRFICQVPSMGPLGYLHTLYAPCTDDMLEEISEVLGFPLPKSYSSFMRLHNGATLFTNTIAIYGLNKEFTRSLKDEDQAAISLADRCRAFKAVSNIDWLQGWRPVGSAAASNLHQLMLDSTGAMKFRSASGRERCYGSFLELLDAVLSAWNGHFNCDGFADADYDNLEIAAEHLASPAN